MKIKCALLELNSAGEPLAVRFRAVEPDGFMSSYSLAVYYGSNNFEETRNPATGSAVKAAYQSVDPFRFYGTLIEAGVADGYLDITIEPTDGAWLPAGVEFCAFSFYLSATDRKTNGYGTPGSHLLDRELVGIKYTPPDPVVIT